MARIAFFGLGAMGRPLAAHLLADGHQVAVYDRSEQACRVFAELGAVVGDSPAATARDCEFVITVLPTSIEVAAMLRGPQGALAAARPGAVFVDMTTGSVADFMALHVEAQSLGMILIDSPIARGPDFAQRRQNLFLTGGEPLEIDRIRPILAPICEEIIHCGPAGTALQTKIINNYLAAVSVVANAEALALAEAAGLDRDFLRTLWKRTVAGRGALETVYPGKALAGDFSPGFSARLARKDLKLAQEMGERLGVPLATGAAARDMFMLQQLQGRIDEDWTALLDVLSTMRAGSHRPR
jgi:4-hydroxybutyrate dehydrogenase/sulfolactaldehyde 3-reductase